MYWCMAAMKQFEGSNPTNRPIRSKIAPQRDPFAIAISVGLLAAVVLVCAVLVSIPLLTAVL
jgi:hypothetical protein